jgi:lipopolysaccharide heptosyltransferase I
VNLLLVKLSAIGDVTHTLPALTTIRRHLPDARITWLVEETAEDIIRGHPALDRVLIWRRREWTRLAASFHWVAATRLFVGFLRELRDTSYDLVIDFQALLKSSIWIALARGQRKAGYGPGLRHDERSYLVLNERVPVVDPNAHAIERNLRLLEGLGFPRLPVRYDFPLLPETDAEAARLLAGLGLEGPAPFVAINAMTRWPTKNWMPEGFAAVVDELATRKAPCVFTGAGGDRVALDAIAAAMRTTPRRLDGRTSLKTLAAVFRRARVVLSTDTGPMHIAVAVGTPVVALFGPTSPGYTGPYGDGHVVLRTGLTCSPCYQKVCRTREYETHACMRRIQASEVVTAVIEALSRHGS